MTTKQNRIIIANHKMHFNFSQLKSWLDIFLSEVNLNLLNQTKLYLAVPASNLFQLNQTLRDMNLSQIIIPVAQSISPHTEGAYTGQISIQQLDSLIGAVIIGHSEVRTTNIYTDQDYWQMAKLALESNKKVFFCAGESLEQYNNGQTISFLGKQLEGLNDLHNSSDKVYICYEPIWAIGSGHQPKLTEILNIKTHLLEQFWKVPMLYGGSVDIENVDLVSSFGLNGILIGGASLDAKKFARLYDCL